MSVAQISTFENNGRNDGHKRLQKGRGKKNYSETCFTLLHSCSSRAKILCSGSEGGAIQVWNLKSGELLHTLQTEKQGKSCSVKSISAGPNGKVVSTYDQRYVQCDCVC